MKAFVALIALFAALSSFAGEFFCKSNNVALLRAQESGHGLQVTTYGELAKKHFASETHVFQYPFKARNSRSEYQSYVEGNEHNVWIYELRLPKNPARHFKAWLNVAHDEMGPDHSWELDCVRTNAPVATTITGKVYEVWCGEVDPFTIGDACIVYVDFQGVTYGFVSHDFDNSEKFERLMNKTINVHSASLSAMKKLEAQELAHFKSSALHVWIDGLLDLVIAR